MITGAHTRFELPDALAATEPPEVTGTSRDEVRMLVADRTGIRHRHFRDLPGELAPGDLVVVNISGTLPAAVDGTREDGRPVVVHFSAALATGHWTIELRPGRRATGPVRDAVPGERVRLPAGVAAILADSPPDSSRLWRARVEVQGTELDNMHRYLTAYGRPIAYHYVPRRWPLEFYQTVFAREPGSAEMPSAGRPFTAELVIDLVTAGIAVVPITLHTGVSSTEKGEPPQSEPFTVPPATARLVNTTRRAGGRIVAVGTTVTRALESAADEHGTVGPRTGWTDLVLSPEEHPARVVDGLVTGWHAPGASHLLLLEAVAGPELVGRAYDEAIRGAYRWHEFGDSCLLLP